MCAFLFCCRGPGQATIERLEDGEELGSYQKQSLEGFRDGDRLRAELIFTAPCSSLTMKMHFQIGVPTRLVSGYYRLQQEDRVMEGSITASSVTFLGGQSDLPNLGGVFRLLSPDGSPLYKVTVPTSELGKPRGGVLENIRRPGNNRDVR